MCAAVRQSRGLPSGRNGIVEEVVGLFEIAAAGGIEVEIGLDVGDAGQGSVASCIEEHPLVIRVDETKARGSFGRGTVVELAELRVGLFRKQENIDSIEIDKGSVGRGGRRSGRVGGPNERVGARGV